MKSLLAAAMEQVERLETWMARTGDWEETWMARTGDWAATSLSLAI